MSQVPSSGASGGGLAELIRCISFGLAPPAPPRPLHVRVMVLIRAKQVALKRSSQCDWEDWIPEPCQRLLIGQNQSMNTGGSHTWLCA